MGCGGPLARDNGYLALERPNNCDYWHRPEVLDLLSWDIGWQKVKIKGCTVGLCAQSGRDAGKPFGKSWRLMTTSPCLKELFMEKCQHAPGEHAIRWI